MWIALFTVAIAFAVLLSVAAFAMRDRDKIGINPMRFFSEKVPLETELAASSKFERAVRRLNNMSEMTKRLRSDSKVLSRRESEVRSVFRACQNCSADDVLQLEDVVSVQHLCDRGLGVGGRRQEGGSGRQ